MHLCRREAAEQAEHAMEAALMEKLTKNLNVNVVDQIQAELTMDDTVMKDHNENPHSSQKILHTFTSFGFSELSS